MLRLCYLSHHSASLRRGQKFATHCKSTNLAVANSLRVLFSNPNKKVYNAIHHISYHNHPRPLDIINPFNLQREFIAIAIAILRPSQTTQPIHSPRRKRLPKPPTQTPNPIQRWSIINLTKEEEQLRLPPNRMLHRSQSNQHTCPIPPTPSHLVAEMVDANASPRNVNHHDLEINIAGFLEVWKGSFDL